MPESDGSITSRDICNQAVVERIIADNSVTSVKIFVNIESDNYSAGSAGWRIERNTGNAEFNDVVVRGQLIAGTGSSVDWSFIQNVQIVNADIDNVSADKITAGTINAETIRLEGTAESGTDAIVLETTTTGARIESDNFSTGLTGFRIESSGDAEFRQVTVEGALIAGSGSSIDGVHINDLAADKITAGTISAETIRIEGTAESGTDGIVLESGFSQARIESDNYSAGSAGFQIVSDGAAEFNDVTVRGTLEAGSGDDRTIISDTSGVVTIGQGAAKIVLDPSSFSGLPVASEMQFWSNSIEIGKIIGRDAAGGFALISQGTENLELDAGSGVIRIGSGSRIRALDAGTAGSPIYSWDTDPDTGFYNPSSGQINVALNGTAIYGLRTDALDSTVPVRVPDGIAATPGFAFRNDIDTGVWLPATGTLAFGTGGVEAIRIDTNQNLDMQNHVIFDINRVQNNGRYTWTTDQDTYIDNPSANQIRMVASGSELFKFFFATTSQARIQGPGAGDIFEIDSTNNWFQWFLNSTETMRNQSNGDTYNGSGVYGTLSDESLKKNVRHAESFLTKLRQLQVRRFDYARDTVIEDGRLGLVAQEVLPVLPELVDERPDDGLLVTKDSKLIYMLLQATQELANRLEAAGIPV